MTRALRSIFHVLAGGLAASTSGHSGADAAAAKDSQGDPCFSAGAAYFDEDVTVSRPNGAYVKSAGACQEACAGVPACRYFTYYAEKRPHGPPGACWLLGPRSASKPDHAALSGPKDCADLANGTGWVESITDTVGGTLAATTGAVATGHGRLQWWAWCLIALVILAGGVGVAAGLGLAPEAVVQRLGGKRGSRGRRVDPDEEDEEDDEELAAAGAWALTSAPASTHSVPLPTYTTASYSALPTAAPPLPMAQVTPRGSTQPRLSVAPRESFYAGVARAPAPAGLPGGQSFAGQSMAGVPRQQSAAVLPGHQSFASIPHQQSFAGMPHQQSFGGVPQHQSFSGNH